MTMPITKYPPELSNCLILIVTGASLSAVSLPLLRDQRLMGYALAAVGIIFMIWGLYMFRKFARSE